MINIKLLVLDNTLNDLTMNEQMISGLFIYIYRH